MSTLSSIHLPGMILALLDTKAYPDLPEHIELAQTQMSFVLLTDTYVYKIKKPVNLGYLDYTTLGKRYYFCQREVELNRRLSPDVYLGVVTINSDEGKVSIEGTGDTIEYAVKMRRLPHERMMDVLVVQDKISLDMLDRLADKLADFHNKAETNESIGAFGDVAMIRSNTDENFNQTGNYVGRTISQEKYDAIKTHTNRFLEEEESLFRQRINDGRIRHCHGDLHAEHICFTNGIAIYDCIEFNDRFRYCDVASEIAFLVMDLDHFGRADLSRHFVQRYVRRSNDPQLLEPINFYKCYRAYVRGKVESFELDDPSIESEQKKDIEKIAGDYFDLAYFYTRPRPVLLITSGLIGTGKTSIANELAKKLGLVVISSDVTRKSLAGIPTTEHRFDDFGEGLYSPEVTEETYQAMFREAEEIVKSGASVILDASFSKSKYRKKAEEIAHQHNADFFVIECKLNEEHIRERLLRREKEVTSSDARLNIFESQKGAFEPFVDVPESRYIAIDTAQPVNELADKVGSAIPVVIQ